MEAPETEGPVVTEETLKKRTETEEVKKATAMFRSNDGPAWVRWDFSSPLFERFFIIGPSCWNEQEAKPIICCEFPEPKPGEESAAEMGMETILFNSGMKFDFVKCGKNKKARLSHFTCKNEIRDKAITMTHSASGVRFTYCLIFRASPLTRPGCLCPQYVSDFIDWRGESKIPICDFALCFVSSHPFFDLLYGLQEQILEIEQMSRLAEEEQEFLFSTEDVPGDVDPAKRWPVTSWYMKGAFLETLYTTTLPGFGRPFALKFAGREIFNWNMPLASGVSLSLAKLGAQPLMDWITLDDFLMLISAVFNEEEIIVTGKNVGDVSRTVTFIPQLASPLAWMGPVATMLPKEKVELLDSPCPMIAGINQDLLPPPYRKMGQELADYLDQEYKVLIHLDKKFVTFGAHLKPVPGINILKSQGLKIIFDRRDSSPEKRMNNSQIETIMTKVNQFITNFITDKIPSQLTTGYDETKNGIGTSFNEDGFKAMFAENEIRFIKNLMDTQLFSCYVEQMCTLRTKAELANEEAEEKATLQAGPLTMGKWSQEMARQVKETTDMDYLRTVVNMEAGMFNWYG